MKRKKILIYTIITIFILNSLTSNLLAQDSNVETLLKTNFSELFGKYKIEDTTIYNPTTKSVYSELYKKLNDANIQIANFKAGTVKEENQIFSIKDLKSLEKNGKLNELSVQITNYKRKISKLMFGKEQYGADSLYCVQINSLFIEYITQNNIELAYNYWTILFNEFPIVNKNIYAKGIPILKYKIEIAETAKDSITKNLYIDTLFLLYDQRIEFYGDAAKYGKGYILGTKGVDMLKYRAKTATDFKAAYDVLMESIELEGVNSSSIVILNAMKANYACVLYKNIDCSTTIKNYLSFIDIIEIQLNKAIIDKDADTETKLTTVKTEIEKYFVKSGCTNCEDLEKYFGILYESNNKNQQILQKIVNNLELRNCNNSDFYEKCALSLFEILPNSENAYRLAKIKLKSEKYEEAADYYNKTIELSKLDDQNLAQYNYEASVVNLQLGLLTQAKNFANKAIEINSNYGAAYLIIAKIYSQLYCNDVFDNKAKYWLIVDKANKAKLLDPTIEKDADLLINACLKNFPTLEECSEKGIKEGQVYKIEYFGETTTVRF